MKVTIVPRGIELKGHDQIPEMRYATVRLDVLSDFGRTSFEIEVVTKSGERTGIEEAIPIAIEALGRFGAALAAKAESSETVFLSHPKAS